MVDLLVVDNDARIADLVAWFLERGGHKPRVVTSYAAARELLREQPFALMLADLELGTEDGRVELPLLESEGLLPPTLVVSGYLDAEITAALLEIPHVLGTVPKPFEPSELLARVDEVIALATEDAVDSAPTPLSSAGEVEMTIPAPPLSASSALEEEAPVEEEAEELRDVLIEPQATPVAEEQASESVGDEEGWIEITSKGFGEGSELESAE
jgi:DNA-binding response OmpR family regulator